MTEGRLIRDNSDPIAARWPLGAYGYYCGHPMAVTPNGELADLSNHSVVETDGKWTVTPSIAVLDRPRAPGVAPKTLYHGFLTDGVWRDA